MDYLTKGNRTTSKEKSKQCFALQEVDRAIGGATERPPLMVSSYDRDIFCLLGVSQYSSFLKSSVIEMYNRTNIKATMGLSISIAQNFSGKRCQKRHCQ